MNPKVLSLIVLFFLLAACGAPVPTKIPSTRIPQTHAQPATATIPTAIPTGIASQDLKEILPAPVYSIADFSGSPQIWRLNLDGTHTRITDAPEGVYQMDVSPADGTIAYSTAGEDGYGSTGPGKRLILVDQNGENPRVLVDGFTVGDPLWSPDGTKLAYYLDGVKSVDFATGIWTEIVKDHTPGTKNGWSYHPFLWSPDGQTLVVWVQYYEGGGYALYTDGGAEIHSADFGGCAQPAFSPDGLALFFAVNEAYYGYCSGEPPLWRLNPQEDVKVRLLPLVQEDRINLSGWPFATPDGRLNFFLGHAFFDAANEWYNAEAVNFSMVSTDLQGGDYKTLRTDANPCCFSEVLWAHDGSLALTLNWVDSNPMILRADDTPPIQIDSSIGHNLRWGLPYREVVTNSPAPTPVSTPGKTTELAYFDPLKGLIVVGRDGTSLLGSGAVFEAGSRADKIVWAPDGKSIYLLLNGSLVQARLSANGLEMSPPAGLPVEEVSFSDMALSPDGRFLAVIYTAEKEASLPALGLLDQDSKRWIRVSLAGSTGQTVFQEIFLSSSAWSANSRQFVFLANLVRPSSGRLPQSSLQVISASRGGSGYVASLFVADSTGTAAQILDISQSENGVLPTADGLRPHWIADSPMILFERDDIHQLFRIDASGNNLTLLTGIDQVEQMDTSNWAASYEISPDGSRIAFTTTVDPDQTVLVVTAIDGSHPITVAEKASPGPGARWSPDGKSIVYPCLIGDNTDLCLVDADGSDFLRLTDTPADEGWATWSADGDQLAFRCGAQADGISRICIVNQDGSGLSEISVSAQTEIMQFAP